MKTQFTKTMLAIVFAAFFVSSCSNDDGPSPDNPSEDGARWITLTAAFPDDEGTAGNGGTLAYAITPENAADPNYEVRVFDPGKGFAPRATASRTSRIQGSADGQFLYNIQYTGADGGVFNKYRISGEGEYEEVGYELNTAVILSTAPRWVVAAEGIGIGVYASSSLSYSGEAPNFVYENTDSEVRVAVIDLESTAITNTAQFEFPWTDEERAAGYSVGRVDVPVLNASKTKVFIGCRVSKVDPNGTPIINNSGLPSWPNDAANIDGTKTLVLDYPSLRNPQVITSGLTNVNNNSYRTMTQYVGTDGHVYQATATSGSRILRISSSTNNYDDSYDFDLKTALGSSNDIAIRAWTYVKDGIGVVLYTESGAAGGYIALVNLNERTATKLDTENQSDVGFSGGSGVTGTFGQFQNISVAGDYVYVPMTPNGKDGNIYVVDWKNKSIAKGAKLKNQSGSFYIGAY